jgi:hypothetical protein
LEYLTISDTHTDTHANTDTYPDTHANTDTYPDTDTNTHTKTGSCNHYYIKPFNHNLSIR